MSRIAIYMTVPADIYREAWGDDASLEACIRARLSEVYDNDGNPVVPDVLGIEVDDEDEV